MVYKKARVLEKKSENWKKTDELKNNWNRLNSKFNRLMILDKLWEKEVGARSKYWKLTAVKNGTILVEVNVPTAKQELLARSKVLIKSLNKNFDSPWIKYIKII
ncbi:MAG: DUF721 domain-containing protein [Elusimicrobiaceae bacterium]|jgi:hypothetical protein|nr:DUF721 domain-containing protein [Elusimicrobiaceae bacterium]MBT4440388.1 DUF721 domain-containing protein [Elusimicrobiaceae bacterium]